MAHKIEDEQLAYVGEVPWHGLGARVESGTSAEAMLKAANLAWDVVTLPAFVQLGARPHPIEHIAVVRPDTGKCFGVAKGAWTPVQNLQTVRFFKQFCAKGDLALETVGAVGGGEYVWALAKVNERDIDIDGDLITQYILIANSHVPGRSLVIRNTMIRVVCNNTLTLAFAEEAEEYGRYVHRSNIHDRIDQARGYVESAINYRRKFKADVKKLIDIKIAEESARELIERCLGIKADGANTDRIVKLFQGTQIGASDLLTVKENAWALLNAVTQYLDHQRGGRGGRDGRMKFSWFGEGERMKTKLMEELLAME